VSHYRRIMRQYICWRESIRANHDALMMVMRRLDWHICNLLVEKSLGKSAESSSSLRHIFQTALVANEAANSPLYSLALFSLGPHRNVWVVARAAEFAWEKERWSIEWVTEFDKHSCALIPNNICSGAAERVRNGFAITPSSGVHTKANPFARPIENTFCHRREMWKKVKQNYTHLSENKSGCSRCMGEWRVRRQQIWIHFSPRLRRPIPIARFQINVYLLYVASLGASFASNL
jgi:hypothetical protein